MSRKTALLVSFVMAAAALLQCGCGTPQQKQARHMATGKRYLERKDYAHAVLEFKNAVKLTPKDAEPYYQLGLTYLQAGDFRTAVAHLMKATELNPKHVGAQITLAQMMASSGNKDVLQEAEKRVQQALAVSPNDVAVLDTLAITDIASSKPEDAEKHLKQALEKFPGHLRSSVLLANLKLAQKDLAGAEDVLKKAVAQSPKTAEPHLALANFYVITGKRDEVEQQFQQALQADPKNGPALIGLARLRVATGRKDEAEKLFQQVSQLPVPAYKSYHALYLLSEGKTDQGIGELARLHKENQADRAIRSQLVSAYMNTGKQAQAEAVLTEALKKNAKDVQALLQRGVIYSLAGKFVESEQDMQKVLQSDPQSAEARFHLARVYAGRGDVLRARQELSQAVQAKPDYLPARLALAHSLLQARDAKGTLETINAAPGAQKQDLRALALRNQANGVLGNFDEMRKGVDEGLKAARLPIFLVQDAGLKFQKNDVAGGRASLEEAIKAAPEDIQALNLLVMTYANKNDLGAGIQKLKGYAAARPGSAVLQLVLGEWLQRAGRRDEARAAFQAAKAAAPKAPEPELGLARVDIQEGKLDAARQRLTPMAAANPPSQDARLLLAGMEEQARNYPAAIEMYRKILAAAPDHVPSLNNLAYLLVEHGNQVDEGLRMAQKAKELAPNDSAVEDTLGWAFYRKGLYASAVPYLESAASKNNTAVRRYHLAMAYVQAGDHNRGRQAFEAALKMNPNLPEAAAARQLIAQAPVKK